MTGLIGWPEGRCSCDRVIRWTPAGTSPGSPGTWMHADAKDADDCTGCPETGIVTGFGVPLDVTAGAARVRNPFRCGWNPPPGGVYLSHCNRHHDDSPRYGAHGGVSFECREDCPCAPA